MLLDFPIRDVTMNIVEGPRTSSEWDISEKNVHSYICGGSHTYLCLPCVWYYLGDASPQRTIDLFLYM